MFKVPERYRLRGGALDSDERAGNNGAFGIDGPSARKLMAIASDGMGWEHVSVSIMGSKTRTPNWYEMEFVKKLFWEDEDWVIEYHPAKSSYKNYHPGCLHLWRPVSGDIPTPPEWMVAP